MTTIAHLGRNITPSGPPSPQPSSSTTSTLISPSPIKSIGDSRRASLLKSLVKIEGEDDRKSGPNARGNLEPHINNIPRRRKRNNIKLALAQESIAMTSADKHDSSSSRPLSRVEAEAGGETLEETRNSVPQVVNAVDSEAPHTNLPQITPTSAPVLTNLPRRRRKPLTPEQLIIQRAYRRCLQEIGEGSGVFVAFTEVDDEEEQDTRKLRKLGGEEFKYVVKVCTAKESRIRKEDDHTLWLYVPSDIFYDDGNPHLDEQQLRVACRFLRIQGAKDKVLITTPKDRAADGMSLAILYLAISKRFIPPTPIFMERPSAAASTTSGSLATAAIAPHPSYMLSRTASSASQHVEADSPIHALLIYLHDLSCDDLEEAYGHVVVNTHRVSGGKDKTPAWKTGSGLRIEWRGTLSREGIDFLDEVLGMLILEQILQQTTL